MTKPSQSEAERYASQVQQRYSFLFVELATNSINMSPSKREESLLELIKLAYLEGQEKIMHKYGLLRKDK